MTDFNFISHGSIVCINPETRAASEYVELVFADTQRWGTAVVAEPRYVADLILRLMNDGFIIAVEGQQLEAKT